MALLVTGAMGHVGYETVKQSAANGIPVVAQYLSTFRERDAEAVGKNVTWVKCDLSDPFEIASMCASHTIDGCIHTAAVPNDKLGLPQPLRTFLSNVASTEYLLETARRNKWRRFIHVSTGSVFQELPDAVTPVPETLQPSPKTLYGGTKRCAEIMTSAYVNSYAISACSVRISWIFGPPLVPQNFDGPRGPIPEFLKRALRGQRIDEPSGGDFKASFTYVTDCALGLIALYEAETLEHSIYHLGSSANQSTFDVVEAIRKAVPGADIRVGSGTLPWTDFTVMRGPLNCQRMEEEFGFTPTFSLESAVSDFADWMRAHPEALGD